MNVWLRQLEAEDEISRQREDEWRTKKKARKANEKAPDDPNVLIRVVPITISCSTLLKRLKNSRDHTLYSFGEELDTLRKTNGAGSWSSKYDIYRLAFDPIDSKWGQDYNSDQAESGLQLDHAGHRWSSKQVFQRRQHRERTIQPNAAGRNARYSLCQDA